MTAFSVLSIFVMWFHTKVSERYTDFDRQRGANDAEDDVVGMAILFSTLSA